MHIYALARQNALTAESLQQQGGRTLTTQLTRGLVLLLRAGVAAAEAVAAVALPNGCTAAAPHRGCVVKATANDFGGTAVLYVAGVHCGGHEAAVSLLLSGGTAAAGALHGEHAAAVPALCGSHTIEAADPYSIHAVVTAAETGTQEAAAGAGVSAGAGVLGLRGHGAGEAQTME